MPKLITKLPLQKIISGGQTGADIGGLKAAKILGLRTGGWMPKGYRTLQGSRPGYAKMYGMREHSLYAYPPRTEQNVVDSDGTVRFAASFESPGEKCTLKFIKKYGVPHIDITVGNEGLDKAHRDFRWWLEDEGIEILNVAGNSEQTCPGIELFVQGFLLLALWDLRCPS